MRSISTEGDDHSLADAFREFLGNSGFPCVGAKSALARDQIEIIVARDIRSNWDDLRVVPHLLEFARTYHQDPEPALFQSFVIIFEQPDSLTEEEFEHYLWQRVQSFSDKDSFFGSEHDIRVAADPSDHNFSLSFGGEAFFVVGLHPNASRPARRFQKPALVFNLHDQFVRLREQGLYEKMRATIMERDLELAGSLNPMMARHGQSSEAKQYSGRVVDNDWQCPYERRDYSAAQKIEPDDESAK
jgi:FPC/CPF motif-containing protein YcgG